MNGVLLLLGLALPRPAAAQGGPAETVVDRFSGETEADGLPKGWRRLQFKDVESRTEYSVERDSDDFVLKAASSGNGTGILKEVSLDLERTPYLTWRWKVANLIKKANLKKKGGDDYPARVYVAFRYDPSKAGIFKRWKYKAAKAKFGDFPPEAALIYIWDNTHPVGEIHENAFTSRAQMVVVESGEAGVGRWAAEKRNVYEDYKKAFKGEPPEVSFVAVMTDTDNTGESATAWYDDIVFTAQ